MPSAPLLAWHRAFDGLPPLGYVLRVAAAERWIRLYSLPGGKRYASTDDESSALIERQNVVASVVLGLGTAVTAWVAHYGDGMPPLEPKSWTWVPEPPQWRGEAAIAERLAGARFFERTLVWTPGVLDDELRLCADDRLASLTVYADVLRRAFCPYDGGMDVFLEAPALVDSIRRLFPHWLSTHSAGL